MEFLTLASVLILLCGPVAGSFIGLLADRLPRGEPVGMTRSACRDCGARLGLRDLVPILSFIALRGRCRHCGATLPGWLLLTEIAATGLALWAVLAGMSAGMPPALVGLVALVLWLLLALALTDLLWLRLPDLLTGALLVLALVLAIAGHGPPVLMALLGAGIGGGSFWLIRVTYRTLRGREGLGLGDVKLMAGIGALLGPFAIPLVVLVAAASLLAVAGLRHLTGTARLSATAPLPFGAALAGAAGLVFVLTL
ncbi:prepilin peptidase [Shimia biformata]|uniref:prepilin peptidase n=1 Tax=Shimia biformata TaxID=1294299 RepID=UPI001950879A|nr:A24 family peptidase [Shimia biformata]